MRIGAFLLAGSLALLGATAAGAEPAGVDTAADATAVAVRGAPFGDVVSVSEPSRLSAGVAADAYAAARDAGGVALPGRAAQIDMVAMRRGGTAVQQAPPGYRIPMGLTVVPADAATFVLSAPVAAALSSGHLVLGATSAGLRGALAGDTIELLDAGGGTLSFTIGLVATDAEVGGAELVARPEEASLLGVGSDTRLIIWGFRSREAIDAALKARGLERSKVRISRSWAAPSPDATIGLARTKALLGEFAYRRFANGNIGLDPAWVDANIHPRMTFSGVGVRASCHNVIVPAIQGALSDLAAAGLGGLIELGSTNSIGGCYAPRLNTITGNLGFLSRHTWAMALDLNITQNPQGRAPRLDCRVVQAFRKWGFAWGGNFVNPDGMHFEYVGERRDQMAYPSPYCPNVISDSAGRVDAHAPAGSDDDAGRTSLFSDDGLLEGHE